MWVEVAGGIGSERAWWERETEELSTQAKDKVESRSQRTTCAPLVQRFDMPLFSHDSGMGMLADSLRRHLESQTQSAEESELLLALEVEKRAALLDELGDRQG